MAADELKSALQDANEVELTVTGRRSGNESTRPIWFVLEDEKVMGTIHVALGNNITMGGTCDVSLHLDSHS